MAGASKYPRLWDRTGSMVAVLKDAYDVIVTDELITGDSQGQEVLDFKLPHGSKNRALIKNEMVVEVGGSRFEVRTPWDGWDTSSPIAITSIHCEAYWYDLAEKDPILIETAITDPTTAMTTILNGTGWTAGTIEPTTGSLQVLQLTSPLALLRLLPQSFGGELQFDNVARKVHLLNHRGSTTAVALYAHGRNLVGNARTEDTTNLVTRLYPYGSASGTINGQSTNGVPIDISTVNGGVPYLEDYSFYDDNGWAHVVRAATVTADNIMDPDTLKTWGQAQLAQMCKPAYSYSIQQSNTGANDAEPNLGDVVRVHDSDLGIDVLARVQLRQRNILQPELTTYNIDTALYTLSQTLAVSTTGGSTVIQGGGDAIDTTIPAAPTNVLVAQSGVAGSAGSTQASETVSWTQVTQNDDASAITDLAGYEIRYAVGAGAWHYLKVPFTDTSAWLGLFEPKMALSVQVRAYDTSDNSSVWASAPDTTTTDDDEPPNPPSAPVLDANTFPGIMRVHWDGLDNAGAPMPSDLAYVEVHASTDATAVATDANLVDTLLIAGYSDLSLPYNQNTYIWFVAMDNAHNVSAPSAKAVGATRQVVDTDLINQAITSAKIATDAVTAEKLGAGTFGTELALNGGFEDPSTLGAPAIAAAWSDGGSGATRSAAAARSGSFGAVLPGSASLGPVSDPIPVSAGDTMACSVWARTLVARATGFYFRIWWYDNLADANVGTVGIVASVDPVSNAATGVAFAEYSGQVVVPTGATYCRLGFYETIVGATAHIDDVSFRKAIKSVAIQDQAIINAKIADLAVNNAKIADLAVTTAKIGDLQVLTAKIGDLQVNDAKIGNMSIGKLTAGLLNADMTVSARIKTADFGARSEMNATGFHVFNSGNQEVATMAIIGGTPTMQIIGGTVQSAIGLGSGSAIKGYKMDSASIKWYTNQSVESAAAYVDINAFAFGGAWYGELVLSSPAMGGQAVSQLTLDSANSNGSFVSNIGLSAVNLTWNGTGSFAFTGNGRLVAGSSGVLNIGSSTSITGNLTLNGNWLNGCAQINNGGGTISFGSNLSAPNIVNGGSWQGSPTIYNPTFANGVNLTGAGLGMGGFNITGLTNAPSATGTALNVSAGGTVQRGSSSRKYKQQISTLKITKADLLALRPVQFKYKADAKYFGKSAPFVWGLIAEEVAEIPNLVPLVHRVDATGDPDSVRYEGLTTALLSLVQQLSDRVDRLEKELAKA